MEEKKKIIGINVPKSGFFSGGEKGSYGRRAVDQGQADVGNPL